MTTKSTSRKPKIKIIPTSAASLKRAKAASLKRGVSWGLTAKQIASRKQFCADPDVHGINCVCLTVPRDRKRRKDYDVRTPSGDVRRVTNHREPINPPLGDSWNAATNALVNAGLAVAVDEEPSDTRRRPTLKSGTTRMRVRDAIRWLQEMPQNHYLGAKVLLDADHPELGTDNYDEVVGISQDDRGVWLLMANENQLAGGYHDALMKAVIATWGAICEGETRDSEMTNFSAIEATLDANHIEKFAGKEGKELGVMLDNLIKSYSHETVVAYIAAYVTLVAPKQEFEFKPGDRVILKADPENNQPREVGTFDGYSGRDKSMAVVTVDEKYRSEDDLDGLREVSVADLEFSSPKLKE